MSANTISVAVRVRPFTDREIPLLQPISNSTPFTGDGSLSTGSGLHPTSAYFSGRSSGSTIRRVVRPLDDRVLVFDPPETNPVANYQKTLLGPSVKKVKDIRFCFDRVFDEAAGQEDIFQGCAQELVPGVLNGFNATVFAYGATGCGKTHTISGSPSQPGIVFLLMKHLFNQITEKQEEMTCEVSISYLEIYNETIRDLLTPNSPNNLGLRENEGRVLVPGLSEQAPSSAEEVVNMIMAANANRTVSATEANAVSSRSHAVLSVNVKQKSRTAAMTEDYTMATLSVIDLAGSERASVTKNKGERLIEGANINRSLLALGNCINALCDAKKSNHIPYRDSKLTRLLKHSLGGNCRTVMIVCVSPSSQHYDESFNTLQYANRAKEIKTKVTRNVVSVDRHVSQYVRVIYELRQELEARKKADGQLENKSREELRQSQAKAVTEVNEASSKIQMAYQEYKDKVARGELQKSERTLLQQISFAVAEWKATVFSSKEPSYPSYTQDIANLLSTYDSRVRVLSSEITFSDNAKNSFEMTCTSASRKVSNPLGNIATQYPELLRLLQGEIKVLELEMALTAYRLQEEKHDQVSQIFRNLFHSLDAVKSKVNTDLSTASQNNTEERAGLVDLLNRIDLATKGLTAKLLPSSLPLSATSSASVSLPSLAVPQVYLAPTRGVSKKRSATMRSPLPDILYSSSSYTRPGKTQRSSLASNIASAITSPARVRKSPKKQVSIMGLQRPPAPTRPSLKTRLLVPKSNNIATHSIVMSQNKEERKAVAWKDDAGQQLTEEHTKSIIDFSDSSGDMSASLSMSVSKDAAPYHPSVFPQTNTAPKLNSGDPAKWVARNIVSEEDESLVSTTSSELPFRILADIGNSSMASSASSAYDTSFASNETAKANKPQIQARTGLGMKARSSIAQISAATPRKNKISGSMARRVSSIGPIRSIKKTRRASHIDPPNLSIPKDDASVVNSMRRAGRAPSERQTKQLINAVEPAIHQLDTSVTGLGSRVAAARAKRQSLAVARASMGFVSSGPSGSGRNFELSLDFSNSSGKALIWK